MKTFHRCQFIFRHASSGLLERRGGRRIRFLSADHEPIGLALTLLERNPWERKASRHRRTQHTALPDSLLPRKSSLHNQQRYTALRHKPKHWRRIRLLLVRYILVPDSFSLCTVSHGSHAAPFLRRTQQAPCQGLR
ncbi:MAG: hypothetical protein WA793_01985 [Sphingorhabdus sp.]